MRSLWRILALQWLGGEGSEALTGDSTTLELLMLAEHPMGSHAFDVHRAPASSQAPAASNAAGRLDPEGALEEECRDGSHD